MNKLIAIAFILALASHGNDRLGASDKDAATPAVREQKMGSGETSTRWGYYGVPSLGVGDLATGEYKVFSGVKPMHFQWFDNTSFFGYMEKGGIGIDLEKHIVHEMYRWNLEGDVIEHLSGHGCHGAASPDGRYFAGESWYFSDRISLNVYQRGESSPLMEIFSHSFSHLTWRNGGRHHVNPSFSRDGMRLYYNKAVNENTSQAFAYDLEELVEGMR